MNNQDAEVEPDYRTRFIPQSDAADLVNLYHLARTIVGYARYERMIQASTWYNQVHPTVSRTAAYKDLEGLLA